MGQDIDITDRTVAYALRVINLYRVLETDGVGRVVGKQLLRSGTSVGANVHEAQGAQTKPDFISKMSIAQKEALESLYWLRIIEEAALVPATRLGDLRQETEQLGKIIASIVVKAKQNL